MAPDRIEKLTPCSPGDSGAMEMTWEDVDPDRLMEPPLTMKDFIKAVKNSRPTVSREDIQKSEDWTRDFGSEG
jgi:vacuolar protein-sorting-associated protein 4